MPKTNYNPFGGKDLKFPAKYKKKVAGVCQRKSAGGKDSPAYSSPFKRQVDFWFYCVCLGVHNNKKKKT